MKEKRIEEIVRDYNSDVDFPNDVENLLSQIMKYFSERNTPFSCEKEFQFELAWLLKQAFCFLNLNYKIHFEQLVDLQGTIFEKRRNYIDLAIENDEGKIFYIELKYKKMAQLAFPYNVYLFMKDIERLEALTEKGARACAIFLSDGNKYARGSNSSAWSDFNLSEGIAVDEHQYSGRYDKYKGYKVTLRHGYVCDWEPKTSMDSENQLTYMILKIQD